MNEQHRLEEFLLVDMDNDRLGILLCLYTGIRLGELCTLKWEDISFGERELNIHATMARIQTPDNPAHRTEVVVTMPKSDCSVRNIPLPENIFRFLKEMEGPQDAYLLTGFKDVFIEPRTMENHFKTVIDEAGIPDANFHALRHTFATRCVEIGFDVKTLSEILGHASVRITMDRYVHPTKAMKQRNMDNLSEMMAGR